MSFFVCIVIGGPCDWYSCHSTVAHNYGRKASLECRTLFLKMGNPVPRSLFAHANANLLFLSVSLSRHRNPLANLPPNPFQQPSSKCAHSILQPYFAQFPSSSSHALSSCVYFYARLVLHHKCTSNPTLSLWPVISQGPALPVMPPEAFANPFVALV